MKYTYKLKNLPSARVRLKATTERTRLKLQRMLTQELGEVGACVGTRKDFYWKKSPKFVFQDFFKIFPNFVHEAQKMNLTYDFEF